MPTIKSSFLNMVMTLGAVTFFAAIALGFVYKATKMPIEKAAMEKQLKAIETVLSGYDNNPVTEKVKVAVPGSKDSLEFFPGTKNGELVGVAVKASSSKGYSGDVWLMVGFKADGTIQNIIVTQHLETPGLGSKMTQPAFVNQFIGKNPAQTNLKVKKDGGEIDAISGATISSRAFSEAVRKAYETIEQSDYGKD